MLLKNLAAVFGVCMTGFIIAGPFAEKYEMEPKVFQSESGKKLNFCIRKMNWDLPGKASVLLFFHGAGERGDDNDRQLVIGAREITEWCSRNKEKTLLLFPQCPKGKQWVDTPWNAPEHSIGAESESMCLAMELLDQILDSREIDPCRIYVAGISMGGFGTWDAISRHPEKFAAAFPVCGGADIAMAERVKEIPILTYHGDKDTVVLTKRTRDMFEAIKKAGGTKITYVEVPGCGHGSWGPAFAEEKNWAWLFSQKKPASFWQNIIDFFTF